jgi:hypothetical protein
MTLLGEEFAPRGSSKGKLGEEQDEADAGSVEVHPLAKQWMKKNGVTSEQLEHFFHFDQGQVIPIALPGNAASKKEQSLNAYMTVGLARFLASGDSAFTDADARKFCEQSGCYDGPNHSKIVKELKNRVTGSKSVGWKLTAPGLSAVAELVKQPRS